MRFFPALFLMAMSACAGTTTILKTEKGGTKLNIEFLQRSDPAMKAILAYHASRAATPTGFIETLSIGPQCGKQHLDFIKEWFKKDSEVLQNIIDFCYQATPAATRQLYYKEIRLRQSGRNVTATFEWESYDMRSGEICRESAENRYLLRDNEVRLAAKSSSGWKCEEGVALEEEEDYKAPHESTR